MSESDITQIRVNNNLVGIIGLKTIMEAMAPAHADSSDSTIEEEILRRVSMSNYIPDSARDLYAQALAREFKKFLGQAVNEPLFKGVRVVILGPGCAQCSLLESEVREAMAEMGLAGDLIHVSDIREIGKYGVMGTPALLINDRVVSVGTTPRRKQIKTWLEAASTHSEKE